MTLLDVKINNDYTYLADSAPTGVEGETWLDTTNGLSYIFTSLDVWEPYELNIDKKFEIQREGFFRALLSFLACKEPVYNGCFSAEESIITIDEEITNNAVVDDYLLFGSGVYKAVAITLGTIEVERDILEVFDFIKINRYVVNQEVCRVAGLMMWYDLYKRSTDGLSGERIGNYSYTREINGRGYPDDIASQIDMIRCVAIC